MAIATTTRKAIREELARLIQRLIPREESRQDTRWVWRDRQEIAGRLRNFDVLMGPGVEVPGGAYGEGIQYRAPLTIRVSYPADFEEMQQLVDADGQDLSALLVQLHEHVGEGLFPVEMELGRGQPLLRPFVQQDEEGAYLIDYVAAETAINFFASDVVSLDPE